MRVGLISPWRALCGVAEHARSFREALERHGVETTLIEIDTELVHRLDGPRLESFIRELVDRAVIDCDLVHLQHEYRLFAEAGRLADSLAALRALQANVATKGAPLFISWHSLPPRTSRLTWRAALHPASYRQWRGLVGELNKSPATRSITHSRFAQEALIRAGLAEQRVAAIPIGCPPFRTSTPSPAQTAARRAKLDIPPEAIVLVLFGFVSAYKGHATALAAMEQLGPRFHLLVAGGNHPLGDAGAVDRLEQMVASTPSLSGRVHITGHLEESEIQDVLGLADVCVAPYEPWAALTSSGAVPTVIASGVPVIASNLPVLKEINDVGHCLVLVPPGNPAALAASVRRVVDGADLRAELRRNAESFCARFTWDETATQHARLYESAISGQSKSQMPRPAENW